MSRARKTAARKRRRLDRRTGMTAEQRYWDFQMRRAIYIGDTYATPGLPEAEWRAKYPGGEYRPQWYLDWRRGR